VYLLSTRAVATYYGEGDELHLAFNFPPLYAPWRPEAWGECIDETVAALGPRQAWPTWVLSNHDNPRHRTRYDRSAAHHGEGSDTRARRSEARARAAAVLLLTLRGTPFVFQGDELGLLDADVPPDLRVDPGGRDGCRAPVPWDGSADHGWPTIGEARVWLPFPPDAGTRNHADQVEDPTSILHLYRRLLALRRRSSALALGRFDRLELGPGLLGYERSAEGESWVVVINFTGEEVDVAGHGRSDLVGLHVVISGDGVGEGGAFGGTLSGDGAVVLAR
jgi:alpha-glucosidase